MSEQTRIRKPAGIGRRDFLRTAAGLTGAALLPGLSFAAPRPKSLPNIVFFVVDDMGWMDSTVYGSRYYETPNLERLAKRSMRFTDAYSAAPLCTATRASMMTGKYPGRLHITGAGGHVPDPPNPGVPESGPPHQKILSPYGKGALPLEEYTLAEALKDAGYRTGFVGKWHLGHDPKYWPEHQGFDVNIGGGNWPGPPSYFSPYHISKLPDGPDGEYIADRLTDEALQFIDESKDKPFYLNFWQYAVHAPYQGKLKYREYFEKKQDPRGAQDNAVMGAMIKSMDESLGRVLDKLEAEGLMDNTIFIFSSDNGGNMYDRTARDGTNLGAWAPEGRTPTNNAPLRLGKGSIYEGGVRVPTMFYWPGKVEQEAVSHEVMSSIDFYPTILDMVGVAPKPGKLFDGISVVPALMGQHLKREAIYCHFPHAPQAVPCRQASWVRKGDWKFIHFYELDEYFPNEYELYNLKDDIAEMHNLVEQEPRRAREMLRMLNKHLEETGADVPKLNPNYDPNALDVVEGWRPGGTCGIGLKDGALQVYSTGGDPIVQTGGVPAAQGKLKVTFRMRTESSGGGNFFWTTAKAPNFGPHQRLDLFPKHDGHWEEITVPFEAAAELQALRIDPSTAPGRCEIDWIRLFGEDGALLKAWEFNG